MLKNILTALTLLLVAPVAHGALTSDNLYLLDNKMGPVANKAALGTEINRSHKSLTVVYDSRVGDCVTSNGDSTVVNCITGNSTFRAHGDSSYSGGSHDLYDSAGAVASLPANAVIVRSWLDVVTDFTSAASLGQLAVQCGGSANIFTSQTMDQYNSAALGLLDGVSGGGASTTFRKVGGACNVEGLVTIEPFSTGKAIIYIEYVVTE